MKREWLKGLGIEDENIINQIMDENGKDVNKEKQKADTLKTELEGTKEQLTTANTTIQSYKDMDIDGIKASADEWKTKYETDTKALKDKILAKDYEVAAKEYLGKFKFANKRVAESIKSDFLSKEFKLEEGKFLGAEDYISSLKENEPESFIDEGKKVPEIIKGTKQKKKDGKMTLSEAMKYKNEHPEVDISTLI